MILQVDIKYDRLVQIFDEHNIAANDTTINFDQVELLDLNDADGSNLVRILKNLKPQVSFRVIG